MCVEIPPIPKRFKVQVNLVIVFTRLEIFRCNFLVCNDPQSHLWLICSTCCTMHSHTIATEVRFSRPIFIHIHWNIISFWVLEIFYAAFLTTNLLGFFVLIPAERDTSEENLRFLLENFPMILLQFERNCQIVHLFLLWIFCTKGECCVSRSILLRKWCLKRGVLNQRSRCQLCDFGPLILNMYLNRWGNGNQTFLASPFKWSLPIWPASYSQETKSVSLATQSLQVNLQLF